MSKVDVEGKNKKREKKNKEKKEENIKLWTCLLVFVIKPLMSSND